MNASSCSAMTTPPWVPSYSPRSACTATGEICEASYSRSSQSSLPDPRVGPRPQQITSRNMRPPRTMPTTRPARQTPGRNHT